MGPGFMMLHSIQGGRNRSGFFSRYSVVVWLIAALVLVFCLQIVVRLVMGSFLLYRILGLARSDVMHHWAWYQPLTYMFLHSPFDMLHILFNGCILWMTGRELEPVVGRNRFLFFYLVAGVFAGLVHILFSGAYVIGASGAVYALLVIFTLLWPDREILVFFILPLKIKYFTCILVALQLFYAQMRRGSGISYYAHLGGAAGGLLLFLLYRKAGFFEKLQSYNKERRMKRHRARVEARIAEREKVDAILDKISSEGIGQLSRRERRFLDEAGKRFDLPPEGQPSSRE